MCNVESATVHITSTLTATLEIHVLGKEQVKAVVWLCLTPLHLGTDCKHDTKSVQKLLHTQMSGLPSFSCLM